MTVAVIVFPASNCDRDAKVAIEKITGVPPRMVWHADGVLPDCDAIVLPGGFAYGDYLRPGAMAAASPIMREVKDRAAKGVPVLGICNGFQVLVECGLLPGALLRNAQMRFVCREIYIKVESAMTPVTCTHSTGQVLRMPVAHGDGNYTADERTLATLRDENRIVFRYCDRRGEIHREANPNGSVDNIAGICNAARNVVGMMPHPERMIEPALGGEDGLALLQALAGGKSADKAAGKTAGTPATAGAET